MSHLLKHANFVVFNGLEEFFIYNVILRDFMSNECIESSL